MQVFVGGGPGATGHRRRECRRRARAGTRRGTSEAASAALATASHVVRRNRPARGRGAVANLSCLFDPDLNAVTAVQQPLDDLQTQSRFNRVLVAIGAAQAVFFALFTGVFGVAGLYESRQWTLQRLLVTPTPRWQVLAGFLTGNLVVVIMQLVLLLLALTVVASIVSGALTLHLGQQRQVCWQRCSVLALALCVSGLGVLVKVYWASRTPGQVQIFGPMVNMTLAALGGAFGFALPAAWPNCRSSPGAWARSAPWPQATPTSG
ncbi:MAG: ABC transporter permease subunit [Caldilineaceae bacterium]